MGDPQKALELYSSSEKLLIGMKILAAGKIPLREALDFAMDYVDAITLGIGSFEELEETLSSAVSFISHCLCLH